jgi:hypothetical protein
MGRAKWARWGHGSCEGYSIHFGYGLGSLGGQVVRNIKPLGTLLQDWNLYQTYREKRATGRE